MNEKETSFAKVMGTLIAVVLIGLTGFAAHFVQVGIFDAQVNQLLGATGLTYLFSLIVKSLLLGYQFLLVVVALQFILVKLELARANDDKLTTNIASALVVGYVLLLITYTVVNIFWTKPEMMFVAGGSWTINRHIEAYQLLSQTDWKDDVPSDAFNIRCASTYDFFKDRWRDKCDYDIKRWVTVDNMVTSGDWQNDKPYVKEYPGKICPDSEIVLGCLRGLVIDKTWTTAFRDSDHLRDGDPILCNLDFGTWSKLSRGVYADMQIGVLDHSPRCRIDNIRASVFDPNVPAYPFPEIKDFANQ